MSVKKVVLPNFGNQGRKKFELETEKVEKKTFLKEYPNDQHRWKNDLIYAEEKISRWQN